MGTKAAFLAGCMTGAGMIVVGYGLVYGLPVGAMIIGTGSLAAGTINLVAWRNEAKQFEAKPSSTSAGVDAERYTDSTRYYESGVSESVFCVYCGQAIPSDAMFCRKCGKKQRVVSLSSTGSFYVHGEPNSQDQ